MGILLYLCHWTTNEDELHSPSFSPLIKDHCFLYQDDAPNKVTYKKQQTKMLSKEINNSSTHT